MLPCRANLQIADESEHSDMREGNCMKVLTGAHCTLHNQPSARSLCADITHGNCPHGLFATRERRSLAAAAIESITRLLMHDANSNGSSERTCPFGLARKAPA